VVQEAGVRRVQAHPQKFWFVENQGKIPENLNKIPKYLGKIPENLGKNGTQRCLTSKTVAQGLQINKRKPFFGGHATKTVGKSCTTTFWASLGKFGQKFFARPKTCLLLHLLPDQSVGYYFIFPTQNQCFMNNIDDGLSSKLLDFP